MNSKCHGKHKVYIQNVNTREIKTKELAHNGIKENYN